MMLSTFVSGDLECASRISQAQYHPPPSTHWEIPLKGHAAFSSRNMERRLSKIKINRCMGERIGLDEV